MDLPPLGPVSFIPVPPVFHSDETGGAFRACSVCGAPLLEDGTAYLIEKAFIKGETIYEYAICMDCHGQVHSELSAASLKRIEHYFGERVDLHERRQQMVRDHADDYAGWLSRCLLSGKPLGDEYQIFGQCDGADLVFAYLPYAISLEEIENIGQVLSKETRERLDDFVDDVLGIPGDGLRLPVMI